MASTTFVMPFARLRMRPLQRWFLKVFNPRLELPSKHLQLSNDVRASLLWWTRRKHLLRGLPFRQPQPSICITTDASLLGWGAHILHHAVSGHWSAQESQLHINTLELLAIFKALQSFKRLIAHRIVQIATDNTAAMYYINKQGGTRSSSLLRLTLEIWDWCIKHDIFISAIHVPGQLNNLADSLSRATHSNHEWSLHPSTVAYLFRIWGIPQIDLFASQKNHKLPTFCTRGPPSPTSKGDAFLYNWKGRFLYAFPPFPLLTRVVAKIQHDEATCILVTPWWPRQPWFAPLLHLSYNTYIRLHNRPDLLSLDDGKVLHPDLQTLKMTAWLISF